VTERPMRVVLDARLQPGGKGGVETVVVGLLEGFTELDDDQLDVRVLAWAGHTDWLPPTAGWQLETAPMSRVARVQRILERRAGRLAAPAGAVAARWAGRSEGPPDDAIDSLRPDVVHFPLQRGGRTRFPYVYQPHDLLHRHLPTLFSRSELSRREALYPSMAQGAEAIAVGTEWVREDVSRQYGVDKSRIFVIPLAPLRSTAGEVPVQPQPPRPYAVYPAANWPHKNHANLFRALAELRRRGIDVPLALTGARVANGVALGSLARQIGVADLVHDYGYVSRPNVAWLVRTARVVVIPTLFEAASFPVWEAFEAATPVACSSVTSLPRQVGEAGLLFDPHDLREMADRIQRLWADAGLRALLTARGRERVSGFTWKETAAGFAALYRHVSRRPVPPIDSTRLWGEPRL
jgi:glycosyltransferase involved in cell wall biosynthesis